MPARSRIVALINKVETPLERQLARETAVTLLRESAIDAVVLAAVRGEKPVLEMCSR